MSQYSWFTVYYKEDNESVVQSFKKLIKDGAYGEELDENLMKKREGILVGK